MAGGALGSGVPDLPSAVSVHSIGPASVNQPLTVRVAVDAALKADLRKVTASRLKKVDRGWEFTLTGSLKAGTGAFVALDFTASTLSGELPDLVHPRVEVFAPQHDPAQRSTLTETATRRTVSSTPRWLARPLLD